jgi:hypothetical protein
MIFLPLTLLERYDAVIITVFFNEFSPHQFKGLRYRYNLVSIAESTSAQKLFYLLDLVIYLF